MDFHCVPNQVLYQAEPLPELRTDCRGRCDGYGRFSLYSNQQLRISPSSPVIAGIARDHACSCGGAHRDPVIPTPGADRNDAGICLIVVGDATAKNESILCMSSLKDIATPAAAGYLAPALADQGLDLARALYPDPAGTSGAPCA